MAPDFESLTLSFSISIFLLVDGYIFRKKSYGKHICRYVGIYTPLLLSLSALIETLVVYPEHTYSPTPSSSGRSRKRSWKKHSEEGDSTGGDTEP